MMNKKKIADLHFMDARSKLLDVAAFFDRIDRNDGANDYRAEALRACVSLLLEKKEERVKAILDALSDEDNGELLESAPFQGAFGAPMKKGGEA